MNIDKYTLNESLTVDRVAEGFVLRWLDQNGKSQEKVANQTDLLALKILTEDYQLKDLKEKYQLSPLKAKFVLRQANRLGFINAPQSKIARDDSLFDQSIKIDNQFKIAEAFTIQWHITNKCDLNCKHCYDRSKRSPLTLAQGLNILNDLDVFCDEKQIRGHVCFSGGNPFLSNIFKELYQEAANKGFSTSILGNVVSEAKLKEIIAIQHPGYYQVSLEGLEEHNDYIRGAGYFKKVLNFLDLLKKLDINSGVMLTLTKDNLDQVLDLAEVLKDKAKQFTFNRLSVVGEAADLVSVEPEKYKELLYKYVEAAQKNKIIGFKDNLINIVLEEQGKNLFDGCTGFGCGAAFNFVAILPDGQVDACRKFPSTIGNINKNSLLEIYDSKKAEQYRKGTSACKACSLRHVCGGCLSVVNGAKKDIFTEKDIACWKTK